MRKKIGNLEKRMNFHLIQMKKLLSEPYEGYEEEYRRISHKYCSLNNRYFLLTGNFYNPSVRSEDIAE